MFRYTREDVKAWLSRPLEPYYPLVLVDAAFIYTRRGDSVSKEGYYTILGVREDRTREVSGGKFTHQYKEWQETSGIIYTLHTWRVRGALPNVEVTLLLPGYVAMTRSAYQGKVPKLNYETNRFRWTE
jgi:transposase-like protein